MAVSTIIGGFREGSLLKRTLLHVTAFVLGSMAFIGLVSLVCVTIARGVLPARGGEVETSPAVKTDVAGKPVLPAQKPRPGATPPRMVGKDG